MATDKKSKAKPSNLNKMITGVVFGTEKYGVLMICPICGYVDHGFDLKPKALGCGWCGNKHLICVSVKQDVWERFVKEVSETAHKSTGKNIHENIVSVQIKYMKKYANKETTEKLKKCLGNKTFVKDMIYERKTEKVMPLKDKW